MLRREEKSFGLFHSVVFVSWASLHAWKSSRRVERSNLLETDKVNYLCENFCSENHEIHIYRTGIKTFSFIEILEIVFKFCRNDYSSFSFFESES